MKKIIFTLLVVQLSLFSCKSALLMVKGVKDPKLETYATTKKYLSKNEMDTARVVYFKDLRAFVYASKKKYLSIPDAYFFDKHGNSVDYRKTTKDCNARVGGFIDDLNAFSEARKDSTKTLSELKRFLTSSNMDLLGEKPADVTVFITWAKWNGSLNKEKAFDWVKLLEQAKQKGISVNYYLLNCDFQENWNLSAKQKADIGLK